MFCVIVALRRNAERFPYDVNSEKIEIYFKKSKVQYLDVYVESSNRKKMKILKGDFMTCISNT